MEGKQRQQNQKPKYLGACKRTEIEVIKINMKPESVDSSSQIIIYSLKYI